MKGLRFITAYSNKKIPMCSLILIYVTIQELCKEESNGTISPLIRQLCSALRQSVRYTKWNRLNSLVSVLHHAEMQGYRVQFQTNLITEIILSSPILMTLKEPTPKGKKRRNETSTMTSLSSTS